MKTNEDPPKSPEERLAMIHRCASDTLESLPQFPKNVSDMTDVEQKIAIPSLESCGALKFIQDASEHVTYNDPNRITPKEAEFLIWALGFVEGRVSAGKEQEIIQRCHEIWPKLSMLI